MENICGIPVGSIYLSDKPSTKRGLFIEQNLDVKPYTSYEYDVDKLMFNNVYIRDSDGRYIKKNGGLI